MTPEESGMMMMRSGLTGRFIGRVEGAIAVLILDAVAFLVWWIL